MSSSCHKIIVFPTGFQVMVSRRGEKTLQDRFLSCLEKTRSPLRSLATGLCKRLKRQVYLVAMQATKLST